MSRVSHADLTRLLEGVNQLYRVTKLPALARACVEVISRLIPCELAALEETNRQANSFRLANNCRSPEADTNRVEEHPRLTTHKATGQKTAMRICKLQALNEFEQTEIGSEVHRGLGVKYQLTCYLDGCEPLHVCIELQRFVREFTERDRTMLDLLRPHLTRAWANAQLLETAKKQTAGIQVLTSHLGIGIVLLTHRNRIEWMTPVAAEFLNRWFEGESFSTGKLPTRLTDWLRQREVCAPSKPVGATRDALVVTGAYGQLRIAAIPRDDTSQCLVFSTDNRAHTLESYRSLGLTGRESEVLYWLVEGKTNPEIGVIVRLSPNTVRKHVEHILGKLRVETRGAAAHLARNLRIAGGNNRIATLSREHEGPRHSKYDRQTA